MRAIPLIPQRDDGVLWVLMIGRVSTLQQNVSNIEAGYAYAQSFLDYPKDKIFFKHFGEQGSGMRTDRRSIVEAAEEIESGQWDVVLMEDVSKPFRNPRWIYAFIQDAVDAGVRVIAPGDNLDTAEENWEIVLGTATLRHGMHIPDTRRRVRRTATETFQKGGMVARYPFGYRKLTKDQADSGEFGPRGLRVIKNPEVTSIIMEMRTRILREDSYPEVANWLENEGIKPGRYVKNGRWTPGLVQRFLRSPILWGLRIFRKEIYDPIFKTGKHRRRANPNPEKFHYPELAHMSQQEHEELIECMNRRRRPSGNAKGRDHPRFNRARVLSYWPGQHAVCTWCDYGMHRCGTYLKCQNALPDGPKSCQNHVQVPFNQVRDKVLPWVQSVLEQHPACKAEMIRSAWEEYKRLQGRKAKDGQDADTQITELRQQGKNLAKAIAKGGNLSLLLEEAAIVQEALAAAECKKTQSSRQLMETNSYQSREDVAAHLDQALERLALTSFDFAILMRRLLPVFLIQPVQALDCPQVRPRAKITLSLAMWCKPGETPFEVSTELDLFKAPVHIENVQRCVDAKRVTPNATLREIAARLGIGYMTVKRALSYAKLMDLEGLTNPYRELKGPPEKASRWKKRKRNKRKESS